VSSARKGVVVIDATDAVARFEGSTRSFVDALDGVSEQAWRLRPMGEPWSLADTVEHVVLANRLVCATLARLLAAPFPAGTPRFDDAAISAGMFDGVAPPPRDLAEPTGRFATHTEGSAALVETRPVGRVGTRHGSRSSRSWPAPSRVRRFRRSAVDTLRGGAHRQPSAAGACSADADVLERRRQVIG